MSVPAVRDRKPIPLKPTASTAADVLAPEMAFDEIWEPVKPAELVIPALGIAPGPPHLVTGSWYTGKTLLLMTLGMSVASGLPLFGLWTPRHGRWIHFDHEMGGRHVRRYLQRIRAGTGAGVESLRGRFSLRVLPQLNLCANNAFEEYCKRLEGFDICTIDPLRAAAPGQDENSSEFRQWLDMLSKVSERTRCSITVLHHGGKPVEGAQRRNTGRGSSAIDDAVQSKFVLTAKEKGVPIAVSHEKTRELDQCVEDFWLRVDADETSVRLTHMLKEEFEEYETTVLSARTIQRDSKVRDAILRIFSKHLGSLRGSRNDLLTLMHLDRNSASRVLSQLVSEGALLCLGRGSDREWKLSLTQ